MFVMSVTCAVIAFLVITSCYYESTFVMCSRAQLDSCLKKQLPKGAKVVSIDSSSTERGVYKVKYKR